MASSKIIFQIKFYLIVIPRLRAVHFFNLAVAVSALRLSQLLSQLVDEIIVLKLLRQRRFVPRLFIGGFEER